jgi:plastocyanin
MFSVQRVHDLSHDVQRSPSLRRSALMAAAFIALVVTGTAWPGDSHRAQAAEAVITIHNFSFTPPLLTVPVGTTVTWVNEDDEPHTVVESNKLFKSHALDTGDKFSFTFSTPGKVEYFCSIHAHMVGAVVVAAGQQSQ